MNKVWEPIHELEVKAFSWMGTPMEPEYSRVTDYGHVIIGHNLKDTEKYIHYLEINTGEGMEADLEFGNLVILGLQMADMRKDFDITFVPNEVDYVTEDED